MGSVHSGSAAVKARLLSIISRYGTYEYIHSAKVTCQWTSGRIVFERLYHQLSSGNLDDWTTDIVEESGRLGRNIPLVLLDEPLDVKQCPCCHKGLNNVFDRGYGLRSVAPNWDRDSVGQIYINPNQPSLAINFALEDRFIFKVICIYAGERTCIFIATIMTKYILSRRNRA